MGSVTQKTMPEGVAVDAQCDRVQGHGQDRRPKGPSEQDYPPSQGDAARHQATGLAPLADARRDLGDLHQAIQAAMGWHDGHLHAFDIAGRQYGDRDTVDDVADERRLTLNGLLTSGVVRFTYTYDFGDNWEHTVVIERTQPTPLDPRLYPACIAGKRNGPPEDCGGPWGYQHLLAVLADPAHPEHRDQIEWIGEEFDPEEFSVEVADAAVATRFNRK
jgi:hypothetical protein